MLISGFQSVGYRGCIPATFVIMVCAAVSSCGTAGSARSLANQSTETSEEIIVNIDLSVREGPAASESPKQILRDWYLSQMPEGGDSPRLVSDEYYSAVDTLHSHTGAAIASARDRNNNDQQFQAIFSFVDPYENFVLLAEEPVVRGLLMRRAVERGFWSNQARAASATIALAAGPKTALQIIPSRSSQTLAASLASIGAIEAVIVDTNGEVVSATTPWFYPSLHNLSGWQTLKEASGDSILVTPSYEAPILGFSLRTVAVPVHDADETTLIGWILATIYAFESSS